MENATKALTIAGGVFISIIVITTLVYSFQQWGIFPSAKDDSTRDSQLIAFNNQFESYNKQNLYGTDVLTVLNKAINNNEKYGITADPGDDYFIDVIINVKYPAEGVKTTTTIYGDGKKDPPESEPYGNWKLSAPKTYKLSNITQLPTLTELTNKSALKTTKKKSGGKIVIIQTFSAYAEFKEKYFTCTSMEKNKYGRICKIEFTEVNSDTSLLHKVS